MNNEIYFIFSYEGQEGGTPYWNNESFVTSKSVDFHPIESTFFLNMFSKPPIDSARSKDNGRCWQIG